MCVGTFACVVWSLHHGRSRCVVSYAVDLMHRICHRCCTVPRDQRQVNALPTRQVNALPTRQVNALPTWLWCAGDAEADKLCGALTNICLF